MTSENRRYPISHIFHPETIAHRDRVVADGGVIRDLYMLNQAVSILKERGLNIIVLGYDPEMFGYKEGVGAGLTMDRAVQKLYSISGVGSDLVQNSVAYQPLLLKKESKNYLYSAGLGRVETTGPGLATDDILVQLEIDVNLDSEDEIEISLVKGLAGESMAWNFGLISGETGVNLTLQLQDGEEEIQSYSSTLPITGGKMSLMCHRNSATGEIRFYKGVAMASWLLIGSPVDGFTGALASVDDLRLLDAETSTPVGVKLYDMNYQDLNSGDLLIGFRAGDYDRSMSDDTIQYSNFTWSLVRSTSVGIKPVFVDRTLVQGDGSVMYLKTTGFTFAMPATIYSVFRCFRFAGETGIFSGYGTGSNGLHTNADGKVYQISGSAFSGLTPPARLARFKHRYDAGNFSAQLNSNPPVVSAADSSAVFGGFTLLAKPDNTGPSNTLFGTVIAASERDTLEQSEIINSIINLSYGRIN